MGSNFSKVGRPIFVTRFQKFSLFLQGEIRVENSHPYIKNELWLQALRKSIRKSDKNTEKTIDRQKHPVGRLLIRTLANEHVLLDVVPGPAKTISAETLSKAVQTKFQRLQFTPNFSCAGLIVTSKEPTSNCLVEPLIQGGTV